MKRFVCLGALMIAAASPVQAEVAEITVAQQFGVSFLPMMLMEHGGLIETVLHPARRKGPESAGCPLDDKGGHSFE